MATITNDSVEIALGSTATTSRSALSWLSPVIIGITAPAIGAILLFPAVAAQSGALIAVLLGLALLVSVFAYTATVFVPSDPVGLQIDKRARLVTVFLASPFAIKQTALDFADVASLRFATFYDQDGYSESGAELTTYDGQTIEFIADLTRSDVDTARRAIGLRDPSQRMI